MNILPILAVGGALLYMSKKKKKKKKPTKGNGSAALPPAKEEAKNGVVDIPPSLRFVGSDPPDIIKGQVGILFSVSFEGVAGTGYAWTLASSPPDNSIEVVSQKGASESEGMPGGGDVTTFILKGAKPGYGSLVFHYQQPWMAGKAPPEQVVEIQTEIS